MTDDPSRDALHAGLERAYQPPPLPPGLRAQVLAAVAREPAIDWQRRRLDLIRDHRLGVAALNRLYLRRCRDAVLAGSSGVAMIGLTIRPLSHWLTPFFATAAPGVAGALALGTGLLLGVIVARDQLGRQVAVSSS